MCRFIAYYRVSTAAQGRSGLGLESQKAAVHAHIGASELLGEFVEVESGKINTRPKLAEAIAMARRTKSTLIIAKLDRLARNVAFVANLLESGIEFVASDMPCANKMMLQMMAVFAEAEAKMISERTKLALAAARARGVVLGNLKNLRESKEKARETSIGQADNYAMKVLPIIRDIVRGGVYSVHKIADALNDRRVATRRGGIWTGTAVRNIILRSGFNTAKALF